MPTRVIDIELNAPLPTPVVLHDETALLALVRQHGRPIGQARVTATGGAITLAELRAAIESQVCQLEAIEPESITSPAPISIVVCTRDRPNLLRTCLEALRLQAAEGHQIIIVDNAPSSDATFRLIEQYPYRYVCEPTPGLNYARNLGTAFAMHDIVAFTDDDCVPDQGWLRGLAVPFQDEQVGAVTGLVMPLELDTLAQEHFETYCANRRVFQPRSYRAPQTPPAAAGMAGMGANMAFRRALLRRLGGFDVRFDCGTPTRSGGDTEMFARVLDAKMTIVYRPDALVWHRHCRDMVRLRRIIFGYGVGLYAVLSKRLLEDHDRDAYVIAIRWLVGPPLKAACDWLRGGPATAPDLVWCEFWGALQGPWRYLAARHRAPQPVR